MEFHPVTSLTFSGYKAFKEKQTLHLKPLTLIFGYNNTGKSAAVRSLPLLASSFSEGRKEMYEASYLDYSAECVRGATFKDLAYGNGSKVSFGIKWGDTASISFELKQDGSDIEDLVSLELAMAADLSSKKYTFRKSINDDAKNIYELSDNNEFKVEVNGFEVKANYKSENIDFNSIFLRQKEFSKSVNWLNSIRVHPPREFRVGAGVELGVKYNGMGTAETIWALAENNSPSFVMINKWLADTCGRIIDIERASSSTILNGRRMVRLDTVPSENDNGEAMIRVPILDLGEGIAQALPVVTLCAQATNGELGKFPVVAIEQPELHLHPKATVVLANFIVKCINKNNNIRLVIETHSESLLIALQIAIVDKALDASDVSCNWVTGGKSGSIIESINFDDDAYISDNWPEDVFRETLVQTRLLITKRRER